MVKKIRLIEDEVPAEEETTSAGVSTEMFELAKSMDWKLWEILQTMQRLEKRLAVTNVEETDEKSKK